MPEASINKGDQVASAVKSIDQLFKTHPSKKGKEELYAKLKEAAKNYTQALIEYTPVNGPDQTGTIRKTLEVAISSDKS